MLISYLQNPLDFVANVQNNNDYVKRFRGIFFYLSAILYKHLREGGEKFVEVKESKSLSFLIEFISVLQFYDCRKYFMIIWL